MTWFDDYSCPEPSSLLRRRSRRPGAPPFPALSTSGTRDPFRYREVAAQCYFFADFHKKIADFVTYSILPISYPHKSIKPHEFFSSIYKRNLQWTRRCNITVCPRSSDPFYLVLVLYKWVTTSWTYSILTKFSVRQNVTWKSVLDELFPWQSNSIYW